SWPPSRVTCRWPADRADAEERERKGQAPSPPRGGEMSTLEGLAVDLTDTATFVDGPPHRFFAELRRAAPVWRHPATPRHPGFWVLPRYHDVPDVWLQPTTFINAHGITIDPNEPAGLSGDEPERGQGALSYTDPPDHRPLRRLLARHFTPARMR